jgi:hypothetical protein
MTHYKIFYKLENASSAQYLINNHITDIWHEIVCSKLQHQKDIAYFASICAHICERGSSKVMCR